MLTAVDRRACGVRRTRPALIIPDTRSVIYQLPAAATRESVRRFLYVTQTLPILAAKNSNGVSAGAHADNKLLGTESLKTLTIRFR